MFNRWFATFLDDETLRAIEENRKRYNLGADYRGEEVIDMAPKPSGIVENAD